jgi:hypothetical protein
MAGKHHSEVISLLMANLQACHYEALSPRLKTKDETHGASPSHDEEPGEDPGMNYQTDDGNRWRQLFSASALPSWDPVWEETHQDFNPHEYKLFRTTVRYVCNCLIVINACHQVGCFSKTASVVHLAKGPCVNPWPVLLGQRLDGSPVQ